jgi:hypothetical protein
VAGSEIDTVKNASAVHMAVICPPKLIDAIATEAVESLDRLPDVEGQLILDLIETFDAVLVDDDSAEQEQTE